MAYTAETYGMLSDHLLLVMVCHTPLPPVAEQECIGYLCINHVCAPDTAVHLWGSRSLNRLNGLNSKGGSEESPAPMSPSVPASAARTDCRNLRPLLLLLLLLPTPQTPLLPLLQLLRPASGTSAGRAGNLQAPVTCSTVDGGSLVRGALQRRAHNSNQHGAQCPSNLASRCAQGMHTYTTICLQAIDTLIVAAGSPWVVHLHLP